MPPYVHRLETLREEAIGASQELSAGQQALVDALHDLQVERGRAADGYRAVVQSLTAVPAVAASDANGRWLLEVFADGDTADLALIEPAARTLMLHCL